MKSYYLQNKADAKIILILCFISMILMIGCNKKSKNIEQPLKTGSVFYNDSANILWRHKVNSIDELKKYSQAYKGIEFDVVYYSDRNEFKVEHDMGSKTGIMLMDYFASIPNPEYNFYWMDIKNLDEENIDSLLNRLLYVFDTYGIKDNVICESWKMRQLKQLNKAGIYTCYWIPDFPYNGKIEKYQKIELDKIINNLKNCKHNAISAPYKMLPFINDYLSDCTVHLWTNGLKTEADKEKILKIAKTPNVKVVLVDYDKPF